MMLRLSFSCLATMVCCSGFAQDTPKASPSCDAYLGAWEYVTPAPTGRFVLVKLRSGKYFGAWVSTPVAGAKPGVIPSSGAGEATCQGSQLHWRAHYPADANRTWVQDAMIEGDIMRFWTVRADGSAADEGRARRIQ